MWNLTDIKEWIVDTKDTIVFAYKNMDYKKKIMAVVLIAIGIGIILL
tara:strand:- start:371 stop:511 length:141 start_codon:yes stop_codon:yes gene_type:complete